MDTVTLSKQNRLLWLGWYAERVYTTTQYMMKQYDRLIDGETVDYETFCQKMGIPCVYDSGDDFCRRYLFDSTSPYSVQSGVEAMLGNGMVLRETITSPTLAYLQMAHSAMELAARSEAPGVELQWVLDDIMAFRGSFDDSVEVETAHRQQRRLRLLCQCALFGHFYPRRGPRLPCGAGAGTGSRGGPPDGGDLRDAEKSGVGAAVHSAGIPRGV